MKKIIFANILSLFILFWIKEPATIMEGYFFYAAFFTVAGSILLSPLIYVMCEKNSRS